MTPPLPPTPLMTNTTDRNTPPNKANKASKPPAKKRKKAGADVIHVAFGSGGGRIPLDVLTQAAAAAAKSALGPSPDAITAPSSSREPVSDVFTSSEVSKLLNVSGARLRSLDRASIVSPSGSRSGRRAYTFQDLIALRATRELLAHRVKIRDVAKAIGALRKSLPRVTRPLQELRIVSDGRSVVVKASDGAFEPVSGQMVLDFQVTALRDDIVRVLRPEATKSRARTAYDLYAHASTLDESPSTFDEAEALYAKAITLDPSLAIAYTNLGNIKFRRGDEAGAEKLYRRAIEIDTEQPEAHYNLGYVMLERGEPRDAVAHFERALGSDPRFSDAHFNIAMAFEQVGERARARPHWKRYLELEPTGTWADIARQHL